MMPPPCPCDRRGGLVRLVGIAQRKEKAEHDPHRAADCSAEEQVLEDPPDSESHCHAKRNQNQDVTPA
jgi:hypothetical protein